MLSHGRLEQLPAISPIVVRLVALDPYSSDYFEQVVEIASSDPDLATRVIGSANSAMSASLDVVDTVPRAVARIGSGRVSYLVLAMSLSKTFKASDAVAVELWHHAIEAAIAARTVAGLLPEAKLGGARAYTAALLHDIGRFMIHAERTDDEVPVEAPPGELAGQLEAERALTGDVDHIEFTRGVCEYWRIPDSIAEMIVNHHEYGDLAVNTPQKAVTIAVQLGDLLSAMLRRHPELPEASDDFAALIAAECVPASWGRLPVSATSLARVVPEIVAQTEQALRDLGLLVAA